jgi:Tfp pilus assembly protein PilF
VSRMLEALQRHKRTEAIPTPRDREPNSTRNGTAVLATLATGRPKSNSELSRVISVVAVMILLGVGAWLGTTWYLSTWPWAVKASGPNAKTAAVSPTPRAVSQNAAPAPPQATVTPAASLSIQPPKAAPTPAPVREPAASASAAPKVAEAAPKPVPTPAPVREPAGSSSVAPRVADAAPTPAPVESAPRPKPAARSQAPSVPAASPSALPVAAVPAAAPAVTVATKETQTDDEHFKLALYYQRSGDFENALIHYRAFLQNGELNAEAHNNLGLLYQSKGLFDDAIREFQRAISIDPKYSKAHNNLGVALLKSGNVDAAASEFRWVQSADPKNVEALVNLAIAQKMGNHLNEARETLVRALTLNSRSPEAHYHLGLIEEEERELATAVGHYEAFVKFAGADQASLVAEVRSRISTLRQRLEPQ